MSKLKAFSGSLVREANQVIWVTVRAASGQDAREKMRELLNQAEFDISDKEVYAERFVRDVFEL